MPYDDDGLAARARAEALEKAIAEKDAELARLKAAHERGFPERPPAPLGAPPTRRPWNSVALWTLGAIAFAAVGAMPICERPQTKMPEERASRSVPIPSCTCAFGDGQSKPLVTLGVNRPSPTDDSGSWALSIERRFNNERSSGVKPFLSAPDSVLPRSGPPWRMGIACDTGTLVLVAGNRATAWSSIDASSLWNTALPAPWVAGEHPDLGPECTPLAVENGATTLLLADGHRVSLSLKKGEML